MKVNLILILFGSAGVFSPDGYCQLKPINGLALPNIQTVAVDRLGNFYFVLADQRLQCYSPDGVKQSETMLNVPAVTLIEPWNPLKIFLYSHNGQTYRFYDRHLSLLETHTLDPSLSTKALLMCPAQEANKAWILDTEEGVLKKINENTLAIDMEVKVPIAWNTADASYRFMRAYQNRLFLLDKNLGIHIFNNLGKLITTIPVTGLDYFNFLGEELCYRRDNEVLLFDIYTGEERKVADLEEKSPVLFTLITDERLLVVTEQGVAFYLYELKN